MRHTRQRTPEGSRGSLCPTRRRRCTVSLPAPGRGPHSTAFLLWRQRSAELHWALQTILPIRHVRHSSSAAHIRGPLARSRPTRSGACTAEGAALLFKGLPSVCTSRDWASRNVAVVPPVGGEAPWLRVAVRVAAVVRGQAAQRRRRALGRQAAQRVRRGEGLVERPCRALRACSSACTGRVGFLRTASLLASRARPAYASVLVWFELLPHRLQSCSECRCRWRHCRSSSRSRSLPPSRGEGWRVPST